MADSDFEVRVEKEIQAHAHPDDIDVIEHPDYEPHVKLVCRTCKVETFVWRGPVWAKTAKPKTRRNPHRHY